MINHPPPLPAAPVIPSKQPAAMDIMALERNERIINEGKDTFVKVGLALLEIREKRGYKLRGFDNFESYCDSQFGFSRRHAYRLMDAAETVIDIKSVSPGVTIESERQARAVQEMGKKNFIEKAQAALATSEPAKALTKVFHDHREQKEKPSRPLPTRR